MLNYSLLAVLFNSYLLNKNLWLITAYKERFGLMHASTVSSIITGIKPLINIFIISLLAFRVRQHLRLIRTLDTVDVCFRNAFQITPPICCYTIVFFVTVAFFSIVPGDIRTNEMFCRFGSSMIHDTAFIIVPTLTLWNIIPLLYYNLYNQIVRFYCNVRFRTLIESLTKKHRKRHFSLKFYYEQFLRITNVQEAVGNLFNPFILFSLAWSMLILCLTIYFITQPHSSLLEPITPEQITVPDIRRRLTRSVHFTICWAGLQVLVALIHISVICHTGMSTNEMTRCIVNAVLRIVPEANVDLDRFLISCFVHKLSTQFMWGMTVWRAFPLERTTFFTLVSVVVTYAFLLLKLKENPAMTPITRSFIFHNGTAFTTISP
uniref:G_PROTEIN_RECEP_F1_2 domain-containing protein n=1 Tax=Angiostrongylus cantonensis TaxID=6313 RepID=A0A158P612_ANGCA